MKEIIHEYMQENQSDWWMNGRIAIVLELLSKYSRKSDSIIDIGAGTGIICENLQNAGYKDITAVDNSETALKILISKHINTIKGKLPKLEIHGQYNFALLLDVLEHIKKDVETLNSIYDKLNDNGKILITVPAFMFLWTPKDNDLGHFRRYTKSTLLNVIKNTQFKVEFISYYNFFLFLPALIYILKNKKTTKTPRYSKSRDKLFTPIFKFEKHFLKNGIKFPFGVSLICILKK